MADKTIICAAYDEAGRYLGWCDVIHDDDAEAKAHAEELNADGMPMAGQWAPDTEQDVAAYRESYGERSPDEVLAEDGVTVDPVENLAGIYDAKTVAELRELATLRGVSSEGKKADLVERLTADDVAKGVVDAG